MPHGFSLTYTFIYSSYANYEQFVVFALNSSVTWPMPILLE
jgi:hypothetical protein